MQRHRIPDWTVESLEMHARGMNTHCPDLTGHGARGAWEHGMNWIVPAAEKGHERGYMWRMQWGHGGTGHRAPVQQPCSARHPHRSCYPAHTQMQSLVNPSSIMFWY